MSYIIAASRKIFRNYPETLKKITGVDFLLVEKKDDLTSVFVSNLDPKYIFFPHWSYIIPPDIYDYYECVIFHMTDVPFGRGGSPLQNLISRGVYQTKITALKCVKELDAGPVYLQKPLSLFGTAEEIYLRAAKIIKEMIVEIIQNKPVPRPQKGAPVCFPRRKPEESNISSLDSLEKVFDYIRMLDAEGYPHAFIETENLRFEFERASLKNDEIHADVRIKIKNGK